MKKLSLLLLSSLGMVCLIVWTGLEYEHLTKSAHNKSSGTVYISKSPFKNNLIAYQFGLVNNKGKRDITIVSIVPFK